MENIIRKGLFIALFFISSVLSAQKQTARETAFYKSYEAEKTAKYTLAINELNKVYVSNEYFDNIRLGWLHYLNKDYKKSEAYYLKSIRLKPYSIEARFGIMKPYSATEQWDKVKAEYKQILKIDPQNTVANYWLGVIYYNRQDYATALKLFEKVVNLYPLDYDSLLMLAWTKLNLAAMNDAKLLFHQVLTIQPNSESAIAGLKLIK